MLTAIRCVAVLLALAAVPKAVLGNVHTVFTTECGTYFTWQALGMIYSHRKSGQPGKITRLMSCTDEQWANYPDKDLVPTHRAPSFTKNPHNNDLYSAYNKPEAVIDWLAHNEVAEEFVLILDADMIMRQPFIPEDMGAKEGTAISAYYGYLKGVNNELALKHVPEVPPRNDTLAGPYGRRGDQVGGFILMHKEDLKRMSPLWLKYAEDVRFDPDAWNLTGDVFSTHPGDKPWISEMYGYSFGAAKANVWHKYHTTAMIYPGYQPVEAPKVLHYGLLWEVEGVDQKYSFDKHWHYQFHATRCPPWDLEGAHTDMKGGLFPHPPPASAFKSHGLMLLRDLLSIEVPLTLNEAFCEHHRKRCPASEELERECGRVERDAKELVEAFRTLQLPASLCEDLVPQCGKWAKGGECVNNQAFMAAKCRRACHLCDGQPDKGAGKAPELKPKQLRKGREGAKYDASAGGKAAGNAPKPADIAAKAVANGAGGADDGAADSAGLKGEQHAGQLPAEAVSSPKSDRNKASPKKDSPTKDLVAQLEDAKFPKAVKSPQLKEEAAPRKVPRAHAQAKRIHHRHNGWSPQEALVAKYTLACTSNSRLSMTQVKECLQAAKDGQPYVVSAVDSGSDASSGGGGGGAGGSDGGAKSTEQQAGDGGVALQQQLSKEELAGGSDSVSRRLRGRTVHAPAKTESSARFLTKLGGIGLVLWCATVLLFLCLLPRSRPARQRFSPYRARKESIL